VIRFETDGLGPRLTHIRDYRGIGHETINNTTQIRKI